MKHKIAHVSTKRFKLFLCRKSVHVHKILNRMVIIFLWKRLPRYCIFLLLSNISSKRVHGPSHHVRCSICVIFSHTKGKWMGSNLLIWSYMFVWQKIFLIDIGYIIQFALDQIYIWQGKLCKQSGFLCTYTQGLYQPTPRH